jgi:ADP-heptose:LPS heptosyltransferase
MKQILVIRRDNIGDLVCTTPLFTALRKRFPDAWIGAFVNSYNAPVLDRNPDLNEVISYTKLKHLGAQRGALGALKKRLTMLWRLRRMKLDCVVLATSDFVPRLARLARLLAPQEVVGFSDGSRRARVLDRAVEIGSVAYMHEVERVFALTELFGIEGAIPPPTVIPEPVEAQKAKAVIAGSGLKVAIHISARRPAQRWPVERFVALINRISKAHGATVMLLWSPGAIDHPQHPGDDAKARQISDKAPDVVAYRTERLAELIGALAACDAVICSDGGASHIAAALGKPTLCFFGDSPVERWRPWGVKHEVLQPASRKVADITVVEAADAFAALLK